MITGMDRLLAAINRTKCDRIPVFTILLDQGAKELGLSIKEYYSKGSYVAEGQLKLREKYGYDNLWSLFYVGKEAELLGCKKILYSDYGPPNVGDLIIKSYDDIDRLEVPDDVYSHPAFADTIEAVAIMKKESGGKYPICAYLTASMTLPAILMGMDNWMQLLLMGPADKRDLLLAKCSEFFQKEFEAYKKVGADVLVYSNPFGSTDFISYKQFLNMSMPWMQKDLAGLDTAGVVYYCGGARLHNSIEDVINTLGLKAFYLSPLDDIATDKKLIGDRGLSCGVINDIMLVSWNEEQVRDEVKRIIMAGKEGGGYLFGTLLMPFDIPDANIRAMLEAAYEYGSFDA